MSASYSIGKHFEGFIQRQLDRGRYRDADEVVRDALRLLEARERQLNALDAALARGIADADAGRVHDLDEACDEILAEIDALPEPRR